MSDQTPDDLRCIWCDHKRLDEEACCHAHDICTECCPECSEGEPINGHTEGCWDDCHSTLNPATESTDIDGSPLGLVGTTNPPRDEAMFTVVGSATITIEEDS